MSLRRFTSGRRIGMLPKPMYTGAGPAARKAASAGAGSYPAGTGGWQYPATCAPATDKLFCIALQYSKGV